MAAAHSALAAQGGLAPIAPEHGGLTLHVQYPKAGSVLSVGDSTFLFGTVGDGRATLTINGASIPVEGNGAWLAWVAVPNDSQPIFRLEARSGRRTERADLQVTRAGWVRRTGAWVLPSTMQPTGAIWWPSTEAVVLSVEARAGASVRLRWTDGRVVALTSNPTGLLDAAAPRAVRYQGTLIMPPNATDRDWLVGDAAPSAESPTLQVIVAGDTTEILWPIVVHPTGVVPVQVALDDDPSRRGDTDGLVNGRNRPGGNYHWFFPNGTTATADARQGESVRLRLGDGAIAWVARAELTATGGPPVHAIMGSPTVEPTLDGVALRLPLSAVVPHQVAASPEGLTISLFGATADADWIRYPVGTDLVSWIDWQQHAADRIDLTVRLAAPLYGWRVHAEADALVFEFRRAPRVDGEAPLRGRVIVLDPGHPPLGACGPTGLCEPVATLAVAQRAAALLRAEGAIVHLTRESASPLELAPRIARASGWNAEVLVSIHLNAHPDGVNPFTQSGTSTFFQHPQSLSLARELQAAMVARFGIPDAGIGRGDLALVRPTWYPAALTEGLFLMIPVQEDAMRSPAGQALYAEAIVSGLRAFFAGLPVSTNSGLGRLPDIAPPAFCEL